MGRNRRKKKGKANTAGGSGAGEEETRGLEEPLLPNANASSPRSPMSIPKPRVVTPPAPDLVAASFDEAPSAETLAEPLLRRDASSPPPRRGSRDGEVRLSVTFQEPVLFQDEEGEGSDARPSGSSDDEAVTGVDDDDCKPCAARGTPPGGSLGRASSADWSMLFCSAQLRSASSVSVSFCVAKSFSSRMSERSLSMLIHRF